MKNVRFIGLDVHAETMAVAVAEPSGEVRSLGMIPNRAESPGRLILCFGARAAKSRRHRSLRITMST
jgi:transposase